LLSKPHLCGVVVLKLDEVEGGVSHGDAAHADNAVHGALRNVQQLAQPDLHVTLVTGEKLKHVNQL